MSTESAVESAPPLHPMRSEESLENMQRSKSARSRVAARGCRPAVSIIPESNADSVSLEMSALVDSVNLNTIFLPGQNGDGGFDSTIAGNRHDPIDRFSFLQEIVGDADTGFE